MALFIENENNDEKLTESNEQNVNSEPTEISEVGQGNANNHKPISAIQNGAASHGIVGAHILSSKAILAIVLCVGVAVGGFLGYSLSNRDETPSGKEEKVMTENTIESQETPSEHTHAFENWTIVSNANCTSAGSEERVCTCGEKETRSIAALGHTVVIDNAVAPDCTHTGLTEGSHCSACQVVLTAQQTVDTKGHTIVHHNAKAPTCTDIGWNAYDSCSECDYTTYSEIAAKGHTIVHHDAKVPTCTEIGWNAYDTCSECNYTIYAEIKATGHNFFKATCTTPATCSACGTIQGGALGHDYVDGICTRCGVFSDTSNYQSTATSTYNGITVTKLPYTSNGLVINSISFRGTLVTINVTNSTGYAISDLSNFPYKCYNSNGTVIKTGNVYPEDLNNGESCNA